VATVQRRIGLLFACFFLLLLLAAIRTLYLGVLRSSALKQAAHSEEVTNETVPAPRGTITDRGGAALAVSEPGYDITADPYLIRDPLETSATIAQALGISQTEVLAKLSEHSGFVYIARAVQASSANALLALKLPGVEGTPVMLRVYPRGALASQVLGMVGAEGGGLAGLEYSEDSVLAGRTGQRRVIRDALGQPISIASIHRERPGTSLRLTLDANIQQESEDVLGAVGAVFHPKDATAIVMEPASGAILAMADWPPVAVGAGALPSLEALQNRAVSFNYEPGSTFKVVAMAGALQEGLITPQSSFEIPEAFEIGGRVIHDAEAHGAETLTASQILAQSSNIGAVKIALLEGANQFNYWVHALGFGAPTGIELPGEEAGVTPAVDQYSGASMGNLPFGQGELVTPIQVANAYAAIADDGILQPPHIVAAVNGRPIAHGGGHRVLSAVTAEELREMLRGPLQPGGTAAEVSVPPYELAGKTGTANKVNPATGEYSTTAYVASFVGFAPVRNPKLLCAVVVDEPQAESIYGGQVAAPAWGQIMSFALPYLGIAPEE
jgi:cell division protein FtsI (penicillin-binding protein 3)